MSFMNDRCFLDTNIFLYAHDNSEEQKQNIARKLIKHVYSEASCAVSTQVLSEFFQNYVMKFKQPYPDALKEMHFMSRCTVIEQSLSLLLAGAKVFNKYSVSWWDALVIAAAAEAEADILYTDIRFTS